MADAEIECEMDEGVARDGELWDDIGNEFRNQKRRTQCTWGMYLGNRGTGKKGHLRQQERRSHRNLKG